jgi:hypothetical protein
MIITAFFNPVGSVGDPDPQDPYVFGPPGSGSLVRGTDADPDHSHKGVEQTENNACTIRF